MVGRAIRAIDSVSGSTRLVRAMVMVGNPSPTRPFTVPAIRNTASPKRICSVVTGRLVPPGDDGRDQGEDGDDLGEAWPPRPAGGRSPRLAPLDAPPPLLRPPVHAPHHPR